MFDILPKNKTKDLRKSSNAVTLLNMLSTFILQGVVFLTTPIFTRLLGSEQYGEYSLFNSWVLILTCVMGLSMHSSIGTGYYHFGKNYKDFRNSILFTSIVISLLEVVVVLLLGALFLSHDFANGIIMLVCISAFSHYVVNFAQTSFIYEKKAVENFVLSVSLSIISVSLSIAMILLANENLKYYARALSVSIVYFIAAFLLIFLFLKSKKPSLNREYIKYGIVVGSPIIFHALSQNVLSQSDRVMMQMFGISNSEIGIYSLFYSFTMLLSVILIALNNSWTPFYYDDLSNEKWKELESKCNHYVELFTVLSVGFVLLSREVSYLMGDKTYMSGINVIPILVFAVYFTFMYQFPVNFEFYHKKTKIIAVGTVLSGLLNIVLNAVFIPVWGMYGAAFATSISYLLLFMAHVIIVSKMKTHKYHLKYRVFIPGLLALFFSVIVFFAAADFWYLRWGVAFLIGFWELRRIYIRKAIFK